MSHGDEKSPSGLASPTAEVPTLTRNAKENSEKSSDVERAGAERGGAVDPLDEVGAFARHDVEWTEAEERALVWRLGASKKRPFLDMLCLLCCLEGTWADSIAARCTLQI